MKHRMIPDRVLVSGNGRWKLFGPATNIADRHVQRLCGDRSRASFCSAATSCQLETDDDEWVARTPVIGLEVAWRRWQQSLHACALRHGRSVVLLGDDTFGQLGTGAERSGQRRRGQRLQRHDRDRRGPESRLSLTTSAVVLVRSWRRDEHRRSNSTTLVEANSAIVAATTRMTTTGAWSVRAELVGQLRTGRQ